MINQTESKTKPDQQEKELLFKKIYGCLLGVAYGDAMGMPTSLMDPQTIKQIFPDRITKLLPAPTGHVIHNGMKAGQITDDTQQTLLLVDLFLEEQKFTKEGVAKKLLDWAKSLNAFESLILGPSSLRALKMIDSGVSIDEAGWMGDTNGAAMKISPAGIVNPGNYSSVIKDVAEICIPTHNTNIAVSGASAVACAVSAAMKENKLDPIIDAFMYGAESGMQFGKKWFGASLLKRTELALKIIRSNKKENEIWQDLYDYVGAGVAMSESVPLSLALFVYYNGNPLKTAEAAANIGGDCDTVGAIAGSIAGAFSGSDIFPVNIKEQLKNVNQIDFEFYSERLTELLVNN